MAIAIELTGVNLQLGEAITQAGEKRAVVVFVDPESGIRIQVPFIVGDATARALAAHVTGRPVIDVASGVPIALPGR